MIPYVFYIENVSELWPSQNATIATAQYMSNALFSPSVPLPKWPIVQHAPRPAVSNDGAHRATPPCHRDTGRRLRTITHLNMLYCVYLHSTSPCGVAINRWTRPRCPDVATLFIRAALIAEIPLDSYLVRLNCPHQAEIRVIICPKLGYHSYLVSIFKACWCNHVVSTKEDHFHNQRARKSFLSSPQAAEPRITVNLPRGPWRPVNQRHTGIGPSETRQGIYGLVTDGHRGLRWRDGAGGGGTGCQTGRASCRSGSLSPPPTPPSRRRGGCVSPPPASAARARDAGRGDVSGLPMYTPFLIANRHPFTSDRQIALVSSAGIPLRQRSPHIDICAPLRQGALKIDTVYLVDTGHRI